MIVVIILLVIFPARKRVRGLGTRQCTACKSEMHNKFTTVHLPMVAVIVLSFSGCIIFLSFSFSVISFGTICDCVV